LTSYTSYFWLPAATSDLLHPILSWTTYKLWHHTFHFFSPLKPPISNLWLSTKNDLLTSYLFSTCPPIKEIKLFPWQCSIFVQINLNFFKSLINKQLIIFEYFFKTTIKHAKFFFQNASNKNDKLHKISKTIFCLNQLNGWLNLLWILYLPNQISRWEPLWIRHWVRFYLSWKI